MGKKVKVESLVNELEDSIKQEFTSEQYQDYVDFRESVKHGEDAFSISRVNVKRDVDISWVDKIEDSVVALDNVLRKPRNFIKDVEEIVPIEMSKKIGSESVKHLATHTNYIQSIEDGKVTPSKILNVYKEESFATYENRFIKTLLQHLNVFIEKRYQGLVSQKDVNNLASAHSIENFTVRDEKVKFKMDISISSPSLNVEGSGNQKDGIETAIQRVLRIRHIIKEFMGSQFMDIMKDAAPVKPPILKTNLLTKNQDYSKLLELWQFIESYTSKGYEVSLNEDNAIPKQDFINKMQELSFLQYLYLKQYVGEDVDESIKLALERQMTYFTPEQAETDEKGAKGGKRAKMVAAGGAGGRGKGGYGGEGSYGGKKGITLATKAIIRKEFSKILGHYTDDLEEVRKIFTMEFEHVNKAVKKEEEALRDALERVIKKQKELNERERIQNIEKEKKEKAKAIEKKKQQELKAKKEEARRLKEIERQIRLKELEEKRKQKEAEKARKEKERAEAERIKQERINKGLDIHIDTGNKDVIAEAEIQENDETRINVQDLTNVYSDNVDDLEIFNTELEGKDKFVKSEETQDKTKKKK